MVVVCTAAAAHGILLNPGFEEGSDGLSAWSPAPEDAVQTATDGLGRYAVLSEPGGANPPSSSSLYQDFVIEPLNPFLSFEYGLSSEGTFAGAGALPDAFTARLLDPATLQPLLSTPGFSEYFYHDARGAADSIDYDPALVTRTAGASRPDWFLVSLDVSSLSPGTPVRLQFDLFGTGAADGQTTLAVVDRVLVPEPAALLSILLTLMPLRRRG